jgi:hypothetical protein
MRAVPQPVHTVPQPMRAVQQQVHTEQKQGKRTAGTTIILNNVPNTLFTFPPCDESMSRQIDAVKKGITYKQYLEQIEPFIQKMLSKGLNITVRDILTLLPPKSWVNDSIIDAFGSLLKRVNKQVDIKTVFFLQ